KNFKHDLEVVVDRLIVREGIETRLADSLETALKLADGLVYLDPADAPSSAVSEARQTFTVDTSDDESTERTGVAAALEEAAERAVLAPHAPEGRIIFSEKFACPASGLTIAEIEPRRLS